MRILIENEIDRTSIVLDMYAEIHIICCISERQTTEAKCWSDVKCECFQYC
jgi:hypothetical protein